MGTASPGSTESNPTPSVLSPPLWMAIGATLCALFALMALDGPERAPRVFYLIRWGAIGTTALGWALFVARDKLTAWIGPVSTVVGVGLLAATLGLAPELLDVPTAGVGDRLWGVPTLLGLPIAGVALLYPDCPRVVGAAGLVLVLVGLLQPITSLGESHLAIQHHWMHIQSIDSLFTLLLGLGVLLCLAGLWVAGRDPASSLPRVCGWLACAALPLWEAVRAFRAWRSEESETVTLAIASLLLLSGCLCWLAAGLSQTPNQPSPQRRVTTRVTEGLVVVLCVGLWLLLKSFSWRWSVTDENIYFYAAQMIAQGEIPYRDFFFAHPPLHLAVPAGFFAVFGFHLGLAKGIAVGASLLTGLLIWHAVRDALGSLAALFALGCFLFAFELLQASTNLNGVNLTSLWLTAGFVLAMRRRWWLSGALLGCAVCTGVYAIAAALALLVLAFFHSHKSGARMVASFVLVAGGINLLFYGLAGDAFVGGVYRYHGLKFAQDTTAVFLKMLHYHPHLALGLLLAPVLLVWQLYRRFPLLGEEPLHERRGSVFSPRKLWEEPGPGLIKGAFLLAITLLVEFTLFKELYDFYFALMFPALAICTGYTAAALLSAGIHELRDVVRGQLNRRLLWVIGLALLWGSQTLIQQETLWVFGGRGWPKELRAAAPPVKTPRAGGRITSRYHNIQPDASVPKTDPRSRTIRGKGSNSEFLAAGTPRHYPWIEPAAWTSVSGPVVRSLFWRGSRKKWNTSPGYRRYLWQKSRYISVADAVGTYVRDHSDADETVAGNATVAPMTALIAERRMAANIVDTNGKRFKRPNDPRFTGPDAMKHGEEIITEEAYFKAICADKIRFLVSSPSGFLSTNRLQQMPTVRTYFERSTGFPDPWAKFRSAGRPSWTIQLWRLKDQYAEQSPRCSWIAP